MDKKTVVPYKITIQIDEHLFDYTYTGEVYSLNGRNFYISTELLDKWIEFVIQEQNLQERDRDNYYAEGYLDALERLSSFIDFTSPDGQDDMKMMKNGL